MGKCEKCNEDITTRKKKFCSYKCRYEHYKKRHNKLKRIRTKEKQILFEKFKEYFGCERCNYSFYGGSIDFHHIDEAKKEKRIKGYNWKSASSIKEMKKCVLLCKNCHHWIHSLEKEDRKKIVDECTCSYKKLIEWKN